MSRTLKLYTSWLVSLSAIALLLTSFMFAEKDGYVLGIRPEIGPKISSSPEVDVLLGVAFWTVVTMFAGALPVRMPRGTFVSVSIAPVIATMVLGGPVAAGWVALIGTTELREARGQVPWYGTAANHAGMVLPAILGGMIYEWLVFGPLGGDFNTTFAGFAAAMIGSTVIFLANVTLVAVVVALRSNQSLRVVWVGDARGFATSQLALAPLAWLSSQVYLGPGGGWATLLFALPLYTTRVAHNRFVEMREMFTQTIGALAGAVDKRDPFTSAHSQRVKQIAVDIGREMHVSEPELEALEWGGLLHDVGKIGVPDSVLLKQERLTREERMVMNAHPVLGAEIIAPVTKLAPELPIIRHHHEWYNGSGYPDRLIGDEIPKLARILHVADAFEAMTAARPYRMMPLTAEQALAELRKFAGIQFDPAVVDAFVRTTWVDGVQDPGRKIEVRPIPLIAQAANRMSQAAARPESAPAERV
jgi:HD-GYP domain-containing protein (c-di-GMP phosphodiesterase class II)